MGPGVKIRHYELCPKKGVVQVDFAGHHFSNKSTWFGETLCKILDSVPHFNNCLNLKGPTKCTNVFIHPFVKDLLVDFRIKSMRL